MKKLKYKSLADISVVAFTEDEPIAVRIMKSGWEGQFHVIIEFGDFSSSEYRGLMDSSQIKNEFGIRIDEIESLSSYVIRLPNDMELGKKLRSVNLKLEVSLF
jgi:hypothetical protein